MAGPGDAADREKLYTERGQNGVVLGRRFAFYSGAPTVPDSFTGNLALGAYANGAGASIIDGIGPPIEEVVPCEEVVVESITCDVFDDLNVTVLYNVLPDDIYILFNTSTGQVLKPLSVTPIVGGVVVVFDDDSPPADAGSWSFKIMRAANPAACFFVKGGCLVIAGAVCDIEITDMTGDGVFPPGPPLFPGTSGTVAVTGSGFLSGGPVTVTMPRAPGPPGPDITVDLVVIIDDNNMTVDFTTPGVDGFYGLTVTLDSDPLCTDSIGLDFGEPQVAAIAA